MNTIQTDAIESTIETKRIELKDLKEQQTKITAAIGKIQRDLCQLDTDLCGEKGDRVNYTITTEGL